MSVLDRTHCMTGGLDLAAGGRDYSALAIAERVEVPTSLRYRRTGEPYTHCEDVFYVRHLKRWPVGTDPGDVLRETALLLMEVRELTGASVLLSYDATGLGAGVRSIVRDMHMAGEWVRRPHSVTITAGQHSEAGNTPKVDLVSHLARLLHEERIRIAGGLEHAAQARAELLGYSVKVTPAGNERFEARTEGLHDDFVTAIALAVRRRSRHEEPRRVLPEDLDDPDRPPVVEWPKHRAGEVLR